MVAKYDAEPEDEDAMIDGAVDAIPGSPERLYQLAAEGHQLKEQKLKRPGEGPPVFVIPIRTLAERGELTYQDAEQRADGPRPLRGIDLAELAQLPIPPEPPSLLFLGEKNILRVGVVNLVSAYAKTGKTTVMARSLAGWIEQGHNVLYLTEEDDTDWQWLLKLEKLDPPPGIRLVSVLGMTLAEILEEAQAAPEDVIVADTARGCLGVEDENDNGKVNAALRPWLALRRGGKTVVIAHHENKAGGIRGRGVGGANAWVSGPDRIVEITVDGDEYSMKRKVHSFGRGGTDQWLTYERLLDGSFVCNPHILGRPSVQLDVVLEAVQPYPMSSDQIAELVGLGERTVKRRLNELHQEGKIRLLAGSSTSTKYWARSSATE